MQRRPIHFLNETFIVVLNVKSPPFYWITTQVAALVRPPAATMFEVRGAAVVDIQAVEAGEGVDDDAQKPCPDE